MKEGFVDYLESIGMPSLLIERVEEIYAFYNENVSPDRIVDLFVSEYVDSIGRREYESLFFFSDLYIMEAKQFASEDDFDVSPLRYQVTYLNVRKQEYDYKMASDASRLWVTSSLQPYITVELKASRANCDHLRDIVTRHITTNMIIGQR